MEFITKLVAKCMFATARPINEKQAVKNLINVVKIESIDHK